MKKIYIIIISVLSFQILAGIFLYLKSEIEFVKLYIPSTDNITKFTEPKALTIFAKDYTVLYKRNFVYSEKLPARYDMTKIMPIVDAYLDDSYLSVRKTGIERWKKIVLNMQGIDPFSLEGAAFIHYTDSLIYNSELKGLKKELLRWYTIKKLRYNYSKPGLTRLFVDSPKYSKNVFGIAAASEYFFNKNIEKADILEIAYLITLLQKRDKQLTPENNHDEIYQNAQSIIRKLYRTKVIDKKEYDYYINKNVKIVYKTEKIIEPSYTNFVLKQIEANKLVMENLGKEDIKIYTAYDKKATEAARKTFKQYFKDKPSDLQAAFILIDTQTQEILTAVGSKLIDTTVNRVFTMSRQMASTFKPFVYLAAFERGNRPSDQIYDIPYTYNMGSYIYKPRNFNNFFMGKIPIRYGMIYSLNNATIRTAELAGLNYVKNLSIKMGMNNSVKPFYSMPLGAFPATPFTVATMYSTIATLGYKINPVLIKEISIGNKNINMIKEPERVVSSESAYQTLYIMQQVVNRGTARFVGLLRGTGAKTGTSNNINDAWTAAIFGKYVAVTWVGYDRIRAISQNSSAGRIAAPIIAMFQKEYFDKGTTFSTEVPGNIVFKSVNSKSGLLTPAGGRYSYIEAFNKQNLPDKE